MDEETEILLAEARRALAAGDTARAEEILQRARDLVTRYGADEAYDSIVQSLPPKLLAEFEIRRADRIRSADEYESYVQKCMQERIPQRLKELGLSARAASLKAGLGPDAIRTILDGRSKRPRHNTLAALARALECTPEYLTGTEQLYPSAQLRNFLPISFVLAHGIWTAADQTRFPTRQRVAAVERQGHSHEFYRQPQWLERLEDDSMAQLAHRGALLRVVDASAISYQPYPDDLVVVERRRAGGAFLERSLKQVTTQDGHTKLRTRPSAGDPLIVSLDTGLAEREREPTELAIKGLVIRAYLGFGRFSHAEEFDLPQNGSE